MGKEKKKGKKKGKKIAMIILLSVLGLIVTLVVAVVIFATVNVKKMNKCVDETVARISEGHTLTEVDAGEYSNLTVYGIMKFHIKQYKIEGLGNLSVMTVNAGVMQMASIVFSPFEKDIPLMSCDYMYMLATRKSYIELYDLVEEKDDTFYSWMERYQGVKDKYAELEDTEASSAWYDYLLTVAIYKTTGPKEDEQIQNMLVDAVGVYLDQADAYETLEGEAKTAKNGRIKEYSDRLIDEGGISTSFFKSSLGEDVTRDFFDKVFFGSAVN